jgi:hypothetical protein
MSQEDRPADLLLREIGEIRSELLGWIDERLEALRQCRESAEAPAPAPVPFREPPEETAGRSEPAAVAPPGDARKRLDDLARQLGKRLRQAEPDRDGGDPAYSRGTPPRRS